MLKRKNGATACFQKIELIDDKTKSLDFNVNYFTQSAITLQAVLVANNDCLILADESMNENSTSMITLTNVLFQIWISVNQNLAENVSNPTSYDVCLQSLCSRGFA